MSAFTTPDLLVELMIISLGQKIKGCPGMGYVNNVGPPYLHSFICVIASLRVSEPS